MTLFHFERVHRFHGRSPAHQGCGDTHDSWQASDVGIMEIHNGIAPEGEDEADIVFPSGKSCLLESNTSTSSPSKKHGRNIAKGDYGMKTTSLSNRRHSPKRLRTPLQSGIYKLTEASVRFNPEKDGVLKRGFSGQRLTPPELRNMLRRLFSIKLTELELSALFAYFVPDGGMELDGNTFIVQFFQVF